MASRRGSQIRRVLSVVAIASVATTVTVVDDGTIDAAAPVITGPATVYTAIDAPLPFTNAPDPISQYNRAITISATDSGCAPSAANGYTSAGCATVKLELVGITHGDLSIGIADELPANTEPSGVVAIATGGAIINQAGGSNGEPGPIFNMFGTVAQLNAALATLVFTPDSGYESKDTPNDDSELRVDAIDGTTTDGTLSSGQSLFVEIRVEGTNDPPNLIVPASPIAVGVNELRAITAPSAPYPFRITDPDVEQAEFDDDLLLIGWVDCGLISLAPSANITADDNIEELLEQQVGLSAEAAQAVMDLLPSEITGLPLSTDISEIEAFAAVGSLSEMNDALYLVEFLAPATASTCTLRMFVSDLGNNGMPFPAIPGQPGTELPFVQINEGLLALKPLETVAFEVTATSTVSLPSSLVVLEGETLVIPATVTPPHTSDFVVEVSHTPGNPATLVDDYSAPSSIATYTAGSTAADIQLFTTEDGDVESDEPLSVGIAFFPTNPPVGVALGNASVGVTIVDDDGPPDSTSPVSTINKAAGQADPTDTGPILFTLQFSEPVNGVTASDVTLTCATCPGLTKVVTGGPSTYTVTVSGMTVADTIVATVPAGAATDASGNPSVVGANIDNAVIFDPSITVTIEQAASQADPTVTLPVTFTATFSAPVTGFDGSDVSFAGSTEPGNLSAVVTPAGPASTYTVTVAGATGPGLIEASVPAGVAVSGATPNAASTSVDNVVTYDPGLNVVTINQAPGQSDPTATAPITFRVEFSQDTPGFLGTHVSLAGSTAGGTLVATVTPGGGPKIYEVTVDGMTTPGTVVATVPAGVVNDNEASTSTDNVVVWDTVGPTLTINQAPGQPDPTKTAPIQFTVVASEALAAGALIGTDISFAGSTVGGTLSATITGGPTTFTVSVNGMMASGNVVASIGASAVTDVAGNANAAPASSTDNVVRWDVTRPTVTVEQAPAPQTDPTEASPIRFSVVFSEPVTGFIASDVVLGGTAGGALVAAISGGGASYTVSVTGMTTPGTVIASVPINRAADAAGNENFASTSTDNSVAWLPVPPTVAIDQAAGQPDPTSASPILFRVVFSEPVTGFATGDVSLAGTAAPTTAVVSPVSQTVYDVAVSGMATSGTVIASVGAGVASDLNGHLNTASTSTDNVVTYTDTTPPTVTIDQAPGQADPTSTTPISFRAVFSEAVSGFDGTDVSFAGSTVGGTLSAAVTGGPADYTVTVTGMTTSGVVVASLGAGAAQDGAANPSVASTSTDNSVTWQEPVGPLTIAVPGNIVRNNDPGQAGAVVTYPSPTSQGGTPPTSITCDRASGAFYPLGTTTVTCTATDALGPQPLAEAVVSASFTITVVDVEPPSIADNPDITDEIAGSTAIVGFPLPAASDNSGVPPTVACAPASGSNFALGTTTVTCTATDGAGNSASSSFVVTLTSRLGGVPTPGGGGGRLPATGTHGASDALALALAACALGGLLRFGSRRRMSP